MKIVWRQKASSKFSCNRVCLMSFSSYFLSQGIGSTCGGILCLEELGAIKLSNGGRSLSRAGIQGKSKECQSLCQYREGCPSVPHGGTAILPVGLALCQPWVGGGSPTCPALFTQGLAQSLVWPVFQVSAGQILCPWDMALLPRASGVMSMWDL